VIDAMAKDWGTATGDVESLKWTLQRVRDVVSDPAAAEARLADLRKAVEGKDLAAAVSTIGRLADLLS